MCTVSLGVSYSLYYSKFAYGGLNPRVTPDRGKWTIGLLVNVEVKKDPLCVIDCMKGNINPFSLN